MRLFGGVPKNFIDRNVTVGVFLFLTFSSLGFAKISNLQTEINFGKMTIQAAVYEEFINQKNVKVLWLVFDTDIKNFVYFFNKVEAKAFLSLVNRSFYALNISKFTSSRAQTFIGGNAIKFFIVTKANSKCVKIVVKEKLGENLMDGCGVLKEISQLKTFMVKADQELGQ